MGRPQIGIGERILRRYDVEAGGRPCQTRSAAQEMSWKQLTSPSHEELRLLLIERRKRAGLTQREVAPRLG
jgi:hypothetical protein